MERNAENTGWLCKACGCAVDDGILPVQWVAHECDNVDAFHERLKTQGTNPDGPQLVGYTLEEPEEENERTG